MMSSIEDELRAGPYRHVKMLAEGGMGEVHVVEHRALREERVMKIVKPADADTYAELAKRLMAEGRALRGLRHANVVEVLDLGVTDSGKPFLVTEYLKGRTLRDEVELRGPLPWREVVDITIQILHGLEAAHRLGVVHRDLKPLNLFYLEPDATGHRGVKILDFGIAKAVSEEAQARVGSALVATRAGYFAGSPPFVSPEQVTAQSLDARTDIYSLGAVCIYLLTRRPPFSGKSLVEYITAHVTEMPEPPSKRVAGIPSALDDVVLQALAKQPEDRFPSSQRMREALEALDLSAEVEVASTPFALRQTELPDATEQPRQPGADEAATERQAPRLEIALPQPSPATADPAAQGTRHVRVLADPALEKLEMQVAQAAPGRGRQGTLVMGSANKPTPQPQQRASAASTRGARTGVGRSAMIGILVLLLLVAASLVAFRLLRGDGEQDEPASVGSLRAKFILLRKG